LSPCGAGTAYAKRNRDGHHSVYAAKTYNKANAFPTGTILDVTTDNQHQIVAERSVELSVHDTKT
jgi:hypothetical protein